MEKLIYGNNNVVLSCDMYEVGESLDFWNALQQSVHTRQNKITEARRKREKEVYFIKQKLCGFLLSVVGMLPIFLESDATFSLFAIPLGLLLMTSRKRVINL